MGNEQGSALTQWMRDVAMAEHDSLAPYRDRIMLSMGAVACIVMLPFAVNNLLQERYLLTAILLCVLAIILADTRALWRQRKPPVPYAALLLPYLVGITAAVVMQGVAGLLWCYPTILFCYFVLGRRVAIWCSLFLLFYVATIAYFFIGPELALRFFGTLLLTIVMVNIVLNVISDLHRKLAAQALSDPLTGLYNRRFMQEILGGIVGRAQRKLVVASALMIDVDHFKRINDELGHERGDRVLCEIATLIGLRLRAHDWLFRWGGEEFVVLLEDTDDAGAALLADDIRTAINAAPIIAGRDVTISIGLAQYRSGQSDEEWLREADEALYRAKAAGRNRVAA